MAIETTSATWTEISKWAQKQYADAVAALLVPNLPERRADFLRGRISLLQDLNTLPQSETKDPDIARPSETYGVL